jgi:hypothetical protein
MDWKPKDWIEHSTFGVGQVSEDRGDRLDIEFVEFGAKTILKTAELKSATPPSPEFTFPRHTQKSGTPRFRVERPPRRPALDFGHLVTCFKRHFPEGFESRNFHDQERAYKEQARNLLNDGLAESTFDRLLHEERYSEVWKIAKDVLQSTNLVHYIEKAKFVDDRNIQYHQPFAKALYDLLHRSAEMEQPFANFCEVLSAMGANKWTIATYYQFLATDGKWMFMKPSIMKRMADALKIALNYKAEPNWLTYSKLQELADRVESELRSRGLTPHSRIDVQGFIWASIWIEEGRYGQT